MSGADHADRIESLLAVMTLEEKIGQLNMVSADLAVSGPGAPGLPLADIASGRVGSVLNCWGAQDTRAIQRKAVEDSRLGVPLFFGFDVIHGHRTIFPIPLAEAGCFDPQMWEQSARIAAEEAAEDGLHLTFAPMLDVARDPRWGRIAETPGEDACVGATFARAKVRGLRNGGVATTAKHFVAYGLVNAGREYAQVDVSERALHDVYLPPFRAAVEAGVSAIMPAFTDIAGLPLHAHRELLTDLVRDCWGFPGIYISDYAGIAELVAHGVAADLTEAAALALKAGIDIDMMGFAYLKGLPGALERGLVTMVELDACVRRVLRFKFELGLFDDPYRHCGLERVDAATRTRRRKLAREIAARSVVLLKNRNGLLPLTPDVGTIALLGPLADARSDMLGPWCALGDQDEVFSLADGLRRHWPHDRILYAAGCGVDGADPELLAAATDAARGSDTILLCLGESRGMSGEAGSRANPALPDAQLALARTLLEMGKPLVLILFSGRPLILPDWLVDGCDAILAAWFGGSEAGTALADILTGGRNPSAKLAVSWSAVVGQIPIWYGQRPTGRPADPLEVYSSKYLDAPVEPRFAFGDGLSYSTFALGAPTSDRLTLAPSETMTITVEVLNLGPSRGRQTVFLFIHDTVASVSRPKLELKGFAQIELDQGEAGVVRFQLTADDLAFCGRDLSQTIEAGTIEVLTGTSACVGDLKRVLIDVVLRSTLSASG